jgi:hypothetical protein
VLAGRGSLCFWKPPGGVPTGLSPFLCFELLDECSEMRGAIGWVNWLVPVLARALAPPIGGSRAVGFLQRPANFFL